MSAIILSMAHDLCGLHLKAKRVELTSSSCDQSLPIWRDIAAVNLEILTFTCVRAKTLANSFFRWIPWFSALRSTAFLSQRCRAKKTRAIKLRTSMGEPNWLYDMHRASRRTKSRLFVYFSKVCVIVPRDQVMRHVSAPMCAERG